MIDEEGLTPEGVEADFVAPEEGQQEPSELEVIASDLGWSPKENWRGDEAEWKPASEFLRETAKINKSLRNDQKSMRDQLSRLERTTSTMIDRVRVEEREKLEAQFAEAVDMGNHDEARSVSAKLAEVSQPVADPSVSDFAARNATWFQIDPIATQVAMATAEMHARAGKSASEQVEAAEAVVKQRFPELFPDERKAKPQAQTEEGASRTANVQVSRKKGYADLPPEAKRAAIEFEKKGVSKDAYADEYWKENA